MSLLPSTYIGYVDGSNNHTWNLAYATWAIFSTIDEMVSFGGMCLGPITNNVAEYNAVIKLITEASTLGICCLIVKLESQLVVSQLKTRYSVCHPTLFPKYIRVHLLERQFDFISYEHIARQFNTLADSLANYVLDWKILH